MRYLDMDDSDDPILSVVNIVDVFLVVIGILMIVLMENPLSPFSQERVTVITDPGTDEMTVTIKDGKTMETYEATGEIGNGTGTRAGTAYRLADGSFIYVPED